MPNESIRDIFEAAGSGSVEDVKHFVEERGVDVNTICHSWGQTPLHLAGMKNTLEVVQYLVSQGADVNATDCSGDTPLYKAAEYNSVDMVKYFISLGADVHAKQKNNGDYTPLLYCTATSNSVEVLQYLVSFCADYDATELLSIAADAGNVDVFQYIISLSADVNAKDEDGNTPLHYADTDEAKRILQEAMEGNL